MMVTPDGTTIATAPQRSARRAQTLRLDPYVLVPLAILLVLIGTTVWLSPGLLRPGSIESKGNAALTLVLVAAGQTFPILIGGIDLSVGSIISVANSLAATQMRNDPSNIAFWVFVIAMFGLTAGAINGFVVAVMKVTPFIATLATWSVWSGVALLVLEKDGGQVSQPFKEIVRSNILLLPGSIAILLVLLVAWFWFKRTRWGVQLYAVGSNEKGAALSGTDVVRVKIMAYAVSGFFAAMAGLYRTVQVGSGSPVAGDGLILPSVAAVVLGGTSLAGGRGGVPMSVTGALILLFINDLIFFAGVRTFYTPMVQGILMVITVAVSAYGYRQGARRARE